MRRPEPFRRPFFATEDIASVREHPRDSIQAIRLLVRLDAARVLRLANVRNGTENAAAVSSRERDNAFWTLSSEAYGRPARMRSLTPSLIFFPRIRSPPRISTGVTVDAI